jgi:hydrocephalus-inducing protein
MTEVKITNACQIRFEYRWLTENFMCLRAPYVQENQKKCPFTVLPSSGFIDAGQTTVFQVRFTPDEVDDFRATLICEIPYLSHMPPPKVNVTGISRRPLCHVDVQTSDYLSGGRRHPDYTTPLPEDVKVIEIFARGLNCRATKKFAIINPTAASYEVFWTLISDSSGGELRCDTPNAFISSGRKHLASFTYCPTTVKTNEAYFEFRIPEHNVIVPLLVVGRIMPS